MEAKSADHEEMQQKKVDLFDSLLHFTLQIRLSHTQMQFSFLVKCDAMTQK